MTEIINAQIEAESSWTSKALGGKEGLMYRLTNQHLDAFDDILSRTNHLKPQDVTRTEFDHPGINPLLAELLHIIQNGRGAVIVSGITRERYSDEEFERIYWGFGTHWGKAATQSEFGDRLGRVTFVPVGPNNPTDRGYKGKDELFLHTDNHEIVGLMCVQKAVKGGWSILASSTAIHNEIQKSSPELLPALYDGYYMATRAASNTDKPITEDKIPVFSCIDGVVSTLFNREFFNRAAGVRGDMSPEFSEAMAQFNALADNPDIHARFMMEPGEMMFINNYTVLHARTPFEDGPDQRRHLLRLWVTPPHGRPVDEIYRRKALSYGKR
jgi:hypothetical protein